ncbi:MAG: NADH-quinone oxidoreductase subunit J [Cyclobacteriaceae bacterium]|nr:NADH-quinone oxidoreductase subunit J [Cyclobacteriaceae bacterium]
MEQVVLYILTGITAASALAIIFVRQVFYAALCLLACLLALAGIYGIMQAGFLAITQILIYAGGVLVLIVFAIVVTNRLEGKTMQVESHNHFVGLIVAAVILQMLLFGYHQTTFLINSQPTANNLKPMGVALFTDYAAPFEIGGVLLLVCLIGAALTASSFKKSVHD